VREYPLRVVDGVIQGGSPIVAARKGRSA